MSTLPRAEIHLGNVIAAAERLFAVALASQHAPVRVNLDDVQIIRQEATRLLQYLRYVEGQLPDGPRWAEVDRHQLEPDARGPGETHHAGAYLWSRFDLFQQRVPPRSSTENLVLLWREDFAIYRWTAERLMQFAKTEGRLPRLGDLNG